MPSTELVTIPQGELARKTGLALPATITNAGEKASRRFVEFFTANIRNKNTRTAYAWAVGKFFDWLEVRRLELHQVEPVVVAAYIEELQKTHSAPSVKQHLAGVRMMFDYLVTGGIVPFNPAASVRGPKHVVKKGKTPVLSAEEARLLLQSIKTDSLVGLRDRALIGVMVYTFARVGATIKIKVEDVFVQKRRLWVRLHEKGGKVNEMPCHHNLESYLQDYLDAAGIRKEGNSLLFRSVLGKTGTLTENGMGQSDVFRMIRRRARQAGIETKIGAHTFRATGLTDYLRNGGKLEIAQRMAGHESARTTGLYDRRDDDISLDEVERIGI